MRNFLYTLFGIGLSVLAANLGLLLTKGTGDGTYVALIIFMTPIVGFIIFKKVAKQIGLGLIIGGAVLALAAFIVMMASGLH